MRRVVFGVQAQRDLRQAWRYIAAERLSAADRLTEEIHGAIELLAQFPGMGHFRADVPNRRYRFWSVARFVIAYRFTSRTLTVVRIVHGARDFRQLFDRG